LLAILISVETVWGWLAVLLPLETWLLAVLFPLETWLLAVASVSGVT
jgi:hypothetical protein